MRNLVGEAYNALDTALMYGAERVTRAWNWTTGGTKADLANTLLSAAPICHSVGTAMLYQDKGVNIVVVLPTTLVSLAMSHLYQKVNRKIEDEEIKLDGSARSLKAEAMKKHYSLIGPCVTSFSGSELLFESYLSEPAYLLRSTYWGLSGASFYVMRTEHLPPRKDCISRGLEKLIDRVKPQPAF